MCTFHFFHKTNSNPKFTKTDSSLDIGYTVVNMVDIFPAL